MALSLLIQTELKMTVVIRNELHITMVKWFERFVVLPKIVFRKKLLVLLDKDFYDRELINFKALVFRRIEIVKSLQLKKIYLQIKLINQQ